MPAFTRRRFISAAAGSAALALLKPSALFAADKTMKNLPSPSPDAAGSLFQYFDTLFQHSTISLRLI